jgi:hypothetical protein
MDTLNVRPMIDGKEVGKQIRRAQTGKKMSDATNRARNLLSTLDREDSVSFYAVRGVLKECIAEIETQCTEGAKNFLTLRANLNPTNWAMIEKVPTLKAHTTL